MIRGDHLDMPGINKIILKLRYTYLISSCSQWNSHKYHNTKIHLIQIGSILDSSGSGQGPVAGYCEYWWTFRFYFSSWLMLSVLETVRRQSDWPLGRDLEGSSHSLKKVKTKSILVPARKGPWSCETLRVPHYLDNWLNDGGKVVSLTRRPPFTPQEN
jgi:hypothetical protein